MGGSSRHALPGPPIKIVILGVHPLPSGPSSPLSTSPTAKSPWSITLRLHYLEVATGWFQSSPLRLLITPLCEPFTLAATLPWAIHPTSSLPDSNLHYAGHPHLLYNLRGPSTPLHPYRITTSFSQWGLHPPSSLHLRASRPTWAFNPGISNRVPASPIELCTLTLTATSVASTITHPHFIP